MVSTSNSMPASPQIDRDRSIGPSELIDRLAADLRDRSDPDLPLSFYAGQIRRQLAREAMAEANRPAHDGPRQQRAGEVHRSVFHAWALSE
jgi:hypothetical protein